MKVNETLKKFLKGIIESPVCEGEEFVKQKIKPFVEAVFSEAVYSSGLKLPIFDVKALDGENEKVRFAIQRDENGNISLCINDFALNHDYAGFKKGPHYSANLSQKKSRVLDIICCAFHEERHLEQEVLASETDICKLSPKAIIYAKELMLTGGNKDFYRANHNSFLIEREAIGAGYSKSAEFVSECMPDSDFANSTIRQSSIGEKQNQKFINDYFHNHIGLISVNPVVEREVDPFAFEVSSVCDECMRNAGGSLLNFYPLLRLVYNEDGTKKTYSQLLQDKTELIRKNRSRLQEVVNIDGTLTPIGSNINKFYSTIIETDKDYVRQREQTEREAGC